MGAFDGLRAIAAIAVVAFHVRLPWLQGGFIGVDVFFVLSGYLITSLLVAETGRTGTIVLGSFWWRRAVRLVPALLLMLAGVMLAAPLFFRGADVFAELLLSGLYLSNIAQVLLGLPKATGHTWSLATEMQFYLLWPFVILAIRRFAPRHMLAVLLALFAAATLWRWLQAADWGWVRTYYAPDTRASGLILGAAAAVTTWRPPPKSTGLMAAAALGVLALAAVSLRFGAVSALLLGGTAVEVATALLILCLLGNAGIVGRLLASPTMVKLGVWSYGLYLWHFPIALVIRDAFNPLTAFCLTLGFGLALAAMSHTWVERPLLQALRGPPGISSAERPRHPRVT